MPRLDRRREAGFTLIELVIVVGLIAILVSVFALGIGRVSASFNLRRAATVAAAELRRAQASAVAGGLDYTVEFVLSTPSGLNVYRAQSPDPCPVGMTQVPSTTYCVMPLTGRENWPASVGIVSAGTTFPLCNDTSNVAPSPAAASNKCVTFRAFGYPMSVGGGSLGVALLRSSSGVTVQVTVAPATGRVGIQ